MSLIESFDEEVSGKVPASTGGSLSKSKILWKIYLKSVKNIGTANVREIIY